MNAKTMGLVIGLALVEGTAWGQVQVEWERTYGSGDSCDEACRSIVQLVDGGFAMGGMAESSGSHYNEQWLMKASNNGDSLWSKAFGGLLSEDCYDLKQTSDSGFALAGVTSSYGSGGFDFWLTKTNSDGDSLWSRTFGGRDNEECFSLLQTGDGGFTMAGVTHSFGIGGVNTWLVKTDGNGDSLWSRTLGGGGAMCYTLIQTTDGGYAMGGTAYVNATDNVFYILRTNSDGDSLWSRIFGRSGVNVCLSLIQTDDGGLAGAGTYNSGADGYDFWLIRMNSNGDSLWSRTFGGIGDDACYSLVETPDGGFALAGYTESFGAGGSDFWLVRTNSNGDSLWSKTFGGIYDDGCSSLIRTSDGGFALAGYTSSNVANSWDFYLIKTTPDPASVRDSSPLTPYTLRLSPAFPNPFNSTTRIGFTIPPGTAGLRLAVFDPLGRRVAELIPASSGTLNLRAGRHEAVWDARGFPAGEYVVRLQAGAEVAQTPVILVK